MLFKNYIPVLLLSLLVLTTSIGKTQDKKDEEIKALEKESKKVDEELKALEKESKKLDEELKALRKEIKDQEKVNEKEVKVLDEKDKIEKQIKEQEKKAIENARNFFKFISSKKSAELKKLLNIPFIFDDTIIYTKKGIDEMIDEMEEGSVADNQVLQYSIDKQANDYTENNIVVILKDNNADTNDIICMWLDRDSLKIIGFFVKEDQNVVNTAEKEKVNDDTTKKKVEPKPKPLEIEK